MYLLENLIELFALHIILSDINDFFIELCFSVRKSQTFVQTPDIMARELIISLIKNWTRKYGLFRIGSGIIVSSNQITSLLKLPVINFCKCHIKGLHLVVREIVSRRRTQHVNA